MQWAARRSPRGPCSQSSCSTSINHRPARCWPGLARGGGLVKNDQTTSAPGFDNRAAPSRKKWGPRFGSWWAPTTSGLRGPSSNPRPPGENRRPLRSMPRSPPLSNGVRRRWPGSLSVRHRRHAGGLEQGLCQVFGRLRRTRCWRVRSFKRTSYANSFEAPASRAKSIVGTGFEGWAIGVGDFAHPGTACCLRESSAGRAACVRAGVSAGSGARERIGLKRFRRSQL